LFETFLFFVLLTVGFAPLAAKAFLATRPALMFGLIWLLLGAAFFLRSGANSPHPFGLIFFLLFFVEWLGAMGVLWINRKPVFKEIPQ
jgi:hypothetical protein